LLALTERMRRAKKQLSVLARPTRSLDPGRYRVYLSPAALLEILGLLSWGGFSERSKRTRTTPLLRMLEGKAQLHPGVSIAEDVGGGVTAPFQNDGFLKPGRIDLISEGALASSLISPRTGEEYAVAHNGAGDSEMPEALDMAGGDLATADALEQLDEGLAVGNLWYMNYSDRAAGRLTGMTRFATFWVENGEITAPVPVMRFDVSLWTVLGSALEALTAERDLCVETSTYFRRSAGGSLVPGALISDFRLTL
jgi:predicted Zn-dependent protease